jgi:DNA replication protein DnaC
MKLYGMHDTFKTAIETGKNDSYTLDQFLAHMVEAEWDDRQNRKITRNIKNARFRYRASVENIIFEESRNIDKNKMTRLFDCTYIKNGESILITGSTGVGKSYIASALGYQACSEGYRVAYYNTAKLFARLRMAKADGSYLKEISRLERQHLLVLDDFGLHTLDNQNRLTLLEIIEDRHGKGSVLITSQVPVSSWYDIIGEKTVADAILDRLVHDAHRIELKGESLRKTRKRTSVYVFEIDCSLYSGETVHFSPEKLFTLKRNRVYTLAGIYSLDGTSVCLMIKSV